MVEPKFDLKNIEKLIGERKSEQRNKQIALGESTGIEMVADNELHELVNAIQTKDPNSRIVKKMKVVEGRSINVDASSGVAVNNNRTPLDENTIKHITSQKTRTQNKPLIHESVGAVGGMQNDLASKDRGDMALNKFNVGGGGGGSMYDLKDLYNNKSGVVNEYNTAGVGANYAAGAANQMMGVNPQIINEQIGNHTVAFINEHFVKLADMALKNHIVETYAVERVKKVLIEDMKPLIKELVVEAIREIQNKNKKKTAK